MEEDIKEEEESENAPKPDGMVGQEQIHGLLFSEKLSWQAIIYDLINTEKLNPWDIDISLLANKYLEKIKEMEEANFFISSKVLLAAALLLRIKSQILLEKDIPLLDDILYGKKEEAKKYTQERLEMDEDVPGLIPRTPLPRFRKVTLQELMSALGKAIQTETRRITRVVVERQREREVATVMPVKFINLHDRIKEIYSKLMDVFAKRETKMAFSELAGMTANEKRAIFMPLLHLDNQHRVVLEQENHFEEIWIWLKHIYEKQYAEELEKMKKEVEEAIEKESKELTPEERERAEEIEKEYKNPLGEMDED